MSDDIDLDSELTSEEQQAIKDAAANRAYAKVVEFSKREFSTLSRSQRIRRHFSFVGVSGRYEGFSGTYTSGSMYRLPKKGRGKVQFWKVYLAVLDGDRVAAMEPLDYFNGFRESDTDAFKRIVGGLNGGTNE